MQQKRLRNTVSLKDFGWRLKELEDVIHGAEADMIRYPELKKRKAG